jgi:hypothetical protein
MMEQKLVLSGKVTFTIIRGDGTKEVITHENMVVTSGLVFYAERMMNNSAPLVGFAGVGSGDTETTLGTVALETEITRVALSSVVHDQNKVIYACTLVPGTGTGAIKEAGLFVSDTEGVMVARTVFPVINKGENDTFGFSWELSLGSNG